jgi:23S rRNA pseudouridine1911/1915/1917 synthase
MKRRGRFDRAAYHEGMPSPWVVADTAAYAVVFKPPRVHTVPLKGEAKEAGVEPSLLDWCGRLFPQALTVRGKHPWEGGIVHRLDYETRGLVLVAKTQAALHALTAQQDGGYIIKEYGALAAKREGVLPGFPKACSGGVDSCIIASGFRPYGPGRKAVRPVVFPVMERAKFLRKPGKPAKTCALDQGKPYVTEILEPYRPVFLRLGIQEAASVEAAYFRLRIKRGFRHQIRCHLAWIGYPIVQDTLYGGLMETPLPNPDADRVYAKTREFPVLGLIAHGIRFYDPVSGEPRQYTIQGL